MNIGAHPLDPASTVGQLRVALGDTSSKPLEPPLAGLASYAVFSDDTLRAYLAMADSGVLRAAANATRTLALEYSTRGRSIKTDDLAIDVRGRGKDLLAVADSFAAEADKADATAGDDVFDIVDFSRGFAREVEGIW